MLPPRYDYRGIRAENLMKNILIISMFSCLLLASTSFAKISDSCLTNSQIDAATNITVKSAGGIPVGTIVAWPVATNPSDWDKWLECNGQPISASAYPELRNVVGPNVPDLRGLFLRGYGSQSHTQNNGSIKGNTATTHASDYLGFIQGDSIREIEGASREIQGNSGAFFNSGGGGQFHYLSCCTGATTIFRASRVTPVANEIRPVNMAVRYLIRARP